MAGLLRSVPAPLLPWVVAGALLFAAAGGVALVAAIGTAPVSRPQPASVELGVPAGSDAGSVIAAIETDSSPLRHGGPPLVLDATLVEPVAFGAIPRIAPDGRRPMDRHRRRASVGNGPIVSILFVEVGLHRTASISVANLPAPVTVAVSPYAEDAPAWFRAARWRGHETLLELPVRPADFPSSDAGPLSLTPEPADAQRLGRALARGIGYLGVAVRAGVFAERSEFFLPFGKLLARRGLALVELGSNALGGVAQKVGLPHLSAEGPIDLDGAAETIDEALERLETRARSEGSAIAFGRPLDVTIERVARWSATLPSKGIELVGVGAVLERRHE